MHGLRRLSASTCLTIGLTAGLTIGLPAGPAFAAHEALVYSFAGGNDGAAPFAGLTSLGSVLYGTTILGGPDNAGTVFSIAPGGIETVVHGFTRKIDGARPQGTVAFGVGTLAVTTREGGSHNGGTAVLVPNLPGSAALTVHNLGGGTDGQMPVSPVGPAIGTTAYVTTRAGGANGLGAICALTPSGKDQVIYSFAGGADGITPLGGLLTVNGTLYGTTFSGGANNAGTVFAVTPDGAEHVVYSFAGGTDGMNPAAGYLVALDGVLYGTTFAGGAFNLGTVFAVTPDGAEHVVYSFTGGLDGANSESGVTILNGRLYTTAQFGGINNNGSVIEVSPDGLELTLYDFLGGTDGANPEAGLLALGGKLYGTTANGGANGLGTVFAIYGM